MKKLLFLIIILLPGLNCLAQQVTVDNNQVRVENSSISRTADNRLTVAMDIILQKNMKVSSNHAAILTPILKGKNHTTTLQPVVVYGRRRQLVNERNNSIPTDAYKIIRRKNNTEQILKYLVQIPFSSWMQKSDLVMNTDLCGCCNAVGNTATDPIASLNMQRPKPNPVVAFIAPKAELVKVRSVVGHAFLDFVVNRTDINPTFRRNATELAKIRATVDTVRNDKNISITGMTIEGYASPDGLYSNNERLAKGRTASLMNYIRNYYSFPRNLMKMTSTPEDWVGYRKWVENSDLALKNEILQIIDSDEPNLDVKERRIYKLVGTDVYHTIATECYMALRHTDYTIGYTVRGFNVEETRSVIKTHPQQLSLQEIYNLAQTYKAGSEDFNNCFQVAVQQFPDDPTANLNAAATELQSGNISAAKKHLAKANPNDGATLNNLGVVALYEGNYDAAEQYFKKAKAAGVSGVDANFTEVSTQKSFPADMD